MLVMIADVESGGLNPKEHSVFSVGALVGNLDTGEILETFEALHKMPSLSDYKYTAKAIEIHGITPNQAFNEGLPTEQIRDKLIDMWHDHGAGIIGGQNFEFDVQFLSHQIFKFDPIEFNSTFTYRKLDSLPIIRVATGHDNVKSGASLTQASKLFNIDMSEYGKNKFHAALFDSIVTFKILHKFRKVVSRPEVMALLTE
jgi:exonuclease I